MSKYWSDFIQQLEPYVPGEQPRVQDLVKLNTNENPYPPSPRVLEVLNTELVDKLRFYPDPGSMALKETLASRFDVEVENIFVGNGSDEVLGFAFMGLFKHNKPLLFPDISYSFYKVYAGLFDIETRLMPLDDDFAISLDDFPADNGGIIFANPNAPTGIGLPLVVIEQLLQRNRDSVLIVDEAYIDFGGETALPLIKKYPNLLVVQTLSKSRSLAGLRLGFAFGDPVLIEGLERVKNSFNSYPVDRLAEQVAIVALNDTEYFDRCCSDIVRNREALCQELLAMAFEVLPSQANFVFARPVSIAAAELFQQLRERKILVRYFDKPRIDGFIRISIGSDEEMQQLLAAIREILAAA